MSEISDNYILRPAQISDTEIIWKMFQNAIERRRSEGSIQWQDGYPNAETAPIDIKNKVGYILEKEGKVAAYAAIIFDIEPAYEMIEGSWLSNEKYAVIHRVVVSEEFIGQGIATLLFLKIEDFVKSKNFSSIKVDTNFDNIPMLKIFEKLNYSYCGEVYFRGSSRKAFEKILQ